MTDKAWQVSKKNGRTVELGGGRKMTVPACSADPPKAWRDAKVIAAAPDLLAACQGAMRIVSLWNGREVPEDHEHAEEMKALYMMQEAFIEAIAKAERGQA